MTYKGVIVSLADLTGHFVEPWVAAGYRAVLVDPQHGQTSGTGGVVERIAGTVLEAAPRLGQILRSERVAFVAGWPPCTDVAVSGSRHFKRKAEANPNFQTEAALVAEQCRMVGMLAGCPWFFENPISVFSSIFGKPNFYFDPCDFTIFAPQDNYTKKNCAMDWRRFPDAACVAGCRAAPAR